MKISEVTIHISAGIQSEAAAHKKDDGTMEEATPGPTPSSSRAAAPRTGSPNQATYLVFSDKVPNPKCPQ